MQDYNFFGKSLADAEPKATDAENNGILVSSQTRSSYYSEAGAYSFKKVLDPRNSYVINNETNLLELSMTISDCDNTEAPYSILNTINMTTDTSILSTSSSDAMVQRRQRKKKRGETKKRVSFHEDIFKMMKLDDDENYVDDSSSGMRFAPPNSVPKKDAQRGR